MSDGYQSFVLFLGVAVYAFGIDDTVKTFIAKLDAAKLGKVVVFSMTAMLRR